jgi:hypothetical protein
MQLVFNNNLKAIAFLFEFVFANRLDVRNIKKMANNKENRMTNSIIEKGKRELIWFSGIDIFLYMFRQYHSEKA